ncbi:MAG TPA: hypothetical protein P5110_02810 [Candidatus Omnitrophota bacterium]|nr:hypothetical protein [Candidatus Omnitrophota bacterium]HRZ14419.1 hypothetical protein [Candidatus Omnitrophota bacterium]
MKRILLTGCLLLGVILGGRVCAQDVPGTFKMQRFAFSMRVAEEFKHDKSFLVENADIADTAFVNVNEKPVEIVMISFDATTDSATRKKYWSIFTNPDSELAETIGYFDANRKILSRGTIDKPRYKGFYFVTEDPNYKGFIQEKVFLFPEGKKGSVILSFLFRNEHQPRIQSMIDSIEYSGGK